MASSSRASTTRSCWPSSNPPRQRRPERHQSARVPSTARRPSTTSRSTRRASVTRSRPPTSPTCPGRCRRRPSRPPCSTYGRPGHPVGLRAPGRAAPGRRPPARTSRCRNPIVVNAEDQFGDTDTDVHRPGDDRAGQYATGTIVGTPTLTVNAVNGVASSPTSRSTRPGPTCSRPPSSNSPRAPRRRSRSIAAAAPGSPGRLDPPVHATVGFPSGRPSQVVDSYGNPEPRYQDVIHRAGPNGIRSMSATWAGRPPCRRERRG